MDKKEPAVAADQQKMVESWQRKEIAADDGKRQDQVKLSDQEALVLKNKSDS